MESYREVDGKWNKARHLVMAVLDRNLQKTIRKMYIKAKDKNLLSNAGCGGF